MVVVALAGVGVWEVKMWRLAREYALRAQNHQASQDAYRLAAAEVLSNPEMFERTQTETLSHSADQHAALAHKWERAARYPWLPVEPDPSER
jgi:hypothetical protein